MRPVEQIEHGTRKGTLDHIARRTPICAACLEASTVYVRPWRKGRGVVVNFPRTVLVPESSAVGSVIAEAIRGGA